MSILLNLVGRYLFAKNPIQEYPFSGINRESTANFALSIAHKHQISTHSTPNSRKITGNLLKDIREITVQLWSLFTVSFHLRANLSIRSAKIICFYTILMSGTPQKTVLFKMQGKKLSIWQKNVLKTPQQHYILCIRTLKLTTC